MKIHYKVNNLAYCDNTAINITATTDISLVNCKRCLKKYKGQGGDLRRFKLKVIEHLQKDKIIDLRHYSVSDSRQIFNMIDFGMLDVVQDEIINSVFYLNS